MRLLATNLLITLIFLLSFRTFATHISAYFSSDTAVHILMAYDLRLPEDLYYWGQDRLGSLLPILAHGLIQVTPLSALEAVSYIQYALLLVGFLSLSYLFKTQVSRLIFAVAWFIPIAYFHELVIAAQPYGPQFAFTGIALAIIHTVLVREYRKPWVRQLLLSTATLCLWIALWISDLQVVFLAILTALTLGKIDRDVNRNGNGMEWGDRLKNLLTPDTLTILITSAFGLAFIIFAKVSADRKSSYGSFSSFSEIAEVISRLVVSAIRTLTFQADSPFLSIYAILIVLIGGSLLYGWYAQWWPPMEIFPPQWTTLFFLNGVLSAGLILVSRWLYANDVSLRYFSVVYISLWMAILLFAEQVAGTYGRRLMLGLLLSAIASILSQPTLVLARETPPSYASRIKALEPLAPAGIIGDYWFSYVLCSTDPAQFNCTPYDDQGQTPCPPKLPDDLVRTRQVRCPHCVRQVLESPQIYLVKNNWLSNFPREIEQFGVCLVRAGKPQRWPPFVLAPYRIQPK